MRVLIATDGTKIWLDDTYRLGIDILDCYLERLGDGLTQAGDTIKVIDKKTGIWHEVVLDKSDISDLEEIFFPT